MRHTVGLLTAVERGPSLD